MNAVIEHAAANYARIALIGFSLGGNLTLKCMGEAPPHGSVVAAVAISAPVDLAASARMLDQRWGNRIYLRRFIDSLITKVEAKARLFPGEIDATGYVATCAPSRSLTIATRRGCMGFAMPLIIGSKRAPDSSSNKSRGRLCCSTRGTIHFSRRNAFHFPKRSTTRVCFSRHPSRVVILDSWNSPADFNLG